MTNQRKITYRKKKGKIIIEGKAKGETVYIYTLPPPEQLINQLLLKKSFITEEKIEFIMQKIQRLDHSGINSKKEP